MLGGVEPSLVAPALADAKKAGIPVIMVNTQDPGPMRKDYPPAVVGMATHSFSWPGRAEADFITVDSKGKAKILFMSTNDLPHITGPEKQAFLNETKRVCPDCKVEVMNVPSSQWSQLTTKTASYIRAHPDVQYIVPDFDGMVIFALPGVHSAHAQDKVKIVSFNATPSVMKALKKKDVVVAETGGPNLLQGWALADQGLRVAAGEAAARHRHPGSPVHVGQHRLDQPERPGIHLVRQGRLRRRLQEALGRQLGTTCGRRPQPAASRSATS